MYSNRKTCLKLTLKHGIEIKNVLSNATNVQMFNPMWYWYRVIQCKERMIQSSNARTFYQTWERVINQCKNRVIQRERCYIIYNARNGLYTATNVIFDKKTRPKKIAITKKKISRFFTHFWYFYVLFLPLLLKLLRIFAT